MCVACDGKVISLNLILLCVFFLYKGTKAQGGGTCYSRSLRNPFIFYKLFNVETKILNELTSQ